MNRIIILLLCLAAVVGVQVTKHAPTERQASSTELQKARQGPPAGPRAVYPYSVIAGGVQSAAEVKAAIQSDPTVAAHYAGINVAKLKLVKQVGDVRRYVSYRMNGSVSWTSKPVTIKDGEVLLTDGSTVLRGRCGNRLSETPQQPTQASTSEPRIDELDKPLSLDYVPQSRSQLQSQSMDTQPDPAQSLITDNTGSAVSSWTPGTDAWSPTLPVQPTQPMPTLLGGAVPSSSAGSQAGGGSAPYIPGPYGPPLILPQGGAGSTPLVASTKGSDEVTATPEPSTIVMIAFGLLGILLLKRNRTSDSPSR